jgi:hypothetical protein
MAVAGLMGQVLYLKSGRAFRASLRAPGKDHFLVDDRCHSRNLLAAVRAEIGALWKALAQRPVDVLVALVGDADDGAMELRGAEV